MSAGRPAAVSAVPDAVVSTPTAQDRTREHAWMPHSPCDAGCLPAAPDTVGVLRRTLRWCAVVIVLLAAAVAMLSAALVPRHRASVQRACAHLLLLACGLRLRVSGTSTWGRPDAPVMVVATHVSWLDAVALPAVSPVSLVARADLAGWPVVGTAARRGRTVFLDRTRLRGLPAVVDEVAGALQSGRSIAVFPEGTTWCGTVHGSFRPAMFQAAVDAGVPVLPVALRYRTRDGRATTAAAFIGDDTLLSSVHRVLGLRGLVLELRLLPLEQPAGDRRELAARCTAAVVQVSAVQAMELPPVRVRLPEHRHPSPSRPGPAHQVSAGGLPATTPSTRGSRRRPSQQASASG